MFSGKSTELIRRIRRYQSIGKKVCVINHNADTRTDNKVQTHYGDNIDSLKYAHLMNFVSLAKLMLFQNWQEHCLFDNVMMWIHLNNSLRSTCLVLLIHQMMYE